MQNTFEIYETRKNEINFYYSIMNDIDQNTGKIDTIDNSRFFKIMKSNFLLMLYNITEACIVSGMLEIYENLKNEGCSYEQVIQEIQDLWSKQKINEIYGPVTKKFTYEKRVKKIIEHIINTEPIVLKKDALGISGNLDAKLIKSMCDKHRIRYVLTTEGRSLNKVKTIRNDLAHGDVSFTDSARDMSLNELDSIKIEVFDFLDNILCGMKDYYDQKNYKVI